MNKEKFTPRPWIIVPNGMIPETLSIESYDFVIAELRDIQEDRSINKANANLIAAAPDMYEALKAIAEYKYDPLRSGTSAMINNEFQAIAKTALSKANGI